ncbi:MAG: alpha/beta hydrolase, partial [Gammaproteobacteria bacterium]|nr:alpha/beta hydrolase [Gammaproteobacteria bacterium]
RQFTTQEEIDQQYNIEVAVGDMRPYVEWFVNGSARARDELDCVLDVPFGPTRDETLDIFPAAEPNAPVLVFIHGGYWRILSSKEFSLVARGPVARGVTVVVTNYSLCPKVTLAEITRQSRAAVSWVVNNIARYNGNPERLYVAGHSAGGQQVGMLVATDWLGEYGLPPNIIKGGMPISGLFDLRPFRHSWLQPKLQLNADLIERQSPLFHVPEQGPPLLVTLGGDESEEFHRQSADYVAAWRARGLAATELAQPGKNHLTAIAGFEDPQSALMEALIAMMAV